MKWGQKLWPLFAVITIILLAVKIFGRTEWLWADAAYSFAAAITAFLLARDMYENSAGKPKVWMLVAMGISSLAFFADGIIKVNAS